MFAKTGVSDKVVIGKSYLTSICLSYIRNTNCLLKGAANAVK